MIIKNQRGDTIVEVIFSLVILSAVLIGALGLAHASRLNSQNSQARTQAINAVQEQYQALREFRNSTSWAEFFQGDAAATFSGISKGNGNGTCVATISTTCPFHMERDPRPASAHYGQWTVCPSEWAPPLDYDSTWNAAGAVLCGEGNAPTAVKVGIQVLPTALFSCNEANTYNLNVYGTWDQGGAVASATTNLETTLANIRNEAQATTC